MDSFYIGFLWALVFYFVLFLIGLIPAFLELKKTFNMTGEIRFVDLINASLVAIIWFPLKITSFFDDLFHKPLIKKKKRDE